MNVGGLVIITINVNAATFSSSRYADVQHRDGQLDNERSEPDEQFFDRDFDDPVCDCCGFGFVPGVHDDARWRHTAGMEDARRIAKPGIPFVSRRCAGPPSGRSVADRRIGALHSRRPAAAQGENLSMDRCARRFAIGSYWIEDVDINGTRTMHGPIYAEDSRYEFRTVSCRRACWADESDDTRSPLRDRSPAIAHTYGC